MPLSEIEKIQLQHGVTSNAIVYRKLLELNEPMSVKQISIAVSLPDRNVRQSLLWLELKGVVRKATNKISRNLYEKIT